MDRIATIQYLYLLKEIDTESYLNVLSNFALIIPGDLANNLEKYIVDLENASVDHIECPSCSATVSRGNPVYKKYNCCTYCGFEFEIR